MHVTFEGNPAQVIADMKQFLGIAPATAAETKATVGKPAKTTAAAQTVVDESKAEAAAASPAATDLSADIKAAAAKYAQNNGRDALESLLKEHGASGGISSVPEENREGFLAALVAA